jgi:hypothetical protein
MLYTNNIRVMRACFLLICLLFIVIPYHAHAETNLRAPNYTADVTWTKEGSPYILDGDMLMNPGANLTIEKGVRVVGATPTDLKFFPFITAWGNVKIEGTPDEPVVFDHIYKILMRGKENEIKNAVFDGTGLSITKNVNDDMATTTVEGSTFMHATSSIQIQGGRLYVKNSTFANNMIGIYSDERALWDRVVIDNSYFENNTTFNLQNGISKTMEASNNWWGSSEGPGNTVVGPATLSPWKTADDRIAAPTKPPCCSNVLFLPGLEASRLYRDEGGILGTSTNRLWEPNRNDDVKKLYLNPDGTSVDQTIYTDGVLDSAFGIKDIYKNFVAMMNGVVADGTIRAWMPFGYDWRMAVEDVVQGQTRYATTTRKLLDEVEKLAASSKTSKVTIIAHSNGGLVAKFLCKELEKAGKSSLIDKVILVAAPLLGTPQAIAGLLHGFDQGILNGFVLNTSIARTLGLHMQSAYGLLPSLEFFNHLSLPLITEIGGAVDSYLGLQTFLSGADGRVEPQENDIKTPAVLSTGLLKKAEALHGAIDTWNFPAVTQVLSIAGWGIPTTRSIDYSSSSPKVIKGIEGDGTVLTLSALNYYGPTLYFNLGLYNHDLKKDASHADILETDILKNILSENIATTSLVTRSSEYLTSDKPTNSYPWMKWLSVSVHSPVDMDIYDDKGGHMGLVPIPNAPADSDVQMLENTLGGHYEYLGDEKYMLLPADGVYTVKLKGTGVGNFTFQVQKFVGETMTETQNIVFADLPVTPLLEASTTLSFQSATSTLHMDVDGNGTTDIEASPNPTLDPLIHLDAMRTIVLSFGLGSTTEKQFLKKIDKIRTLLTKDKTDKAIQKLHKITATLEATSGKHHKLTDKEKADLTALFQSVLDALDS